MEIMGLNGDINTFYMKAFDFSYLLSTIGVKKVVTVWNINHTKMGVLPRHSVMISTDLQGLPL